MLEAPEADALALELQSFVHAVRGEREVVVAARRDGRRWRWRCGWPTRSQTPPLAGADAGMIARAGAPDLRLRGRALG